MSAALPWPVWVATGLLFVVLAALGGRYGFHRDELYFIEGGHHLAWAQPDNPMLVPLLASGWHDIVGGRLWAFRLLPAAVAASVVAIGAATSRLLGGSTRHQSATAILVAVTAILVGTGHLFSITTFDLALTSLVLMLLLRALLSADDQARPRLGPWLLPGVAAGVALEVKALLVMVLICCLAGLLIAGPRKPLTQPGPWLAAAGAAVLAAPNVVWQATHSWPMLEIAASIAAGGSTSSTDRVMVFPMHLLMAGVVSGSVLVIGTIALFRRPVLRPWRWLAVAYVLMLIMVIVTGGKPYYLAGFYPALIAAGAGPVMEWVDKTRPRRRGTVLAAAVLSIPSAFISLPLAPVGSAVYRAAVVVNPDVAETVGWDGYLDTVRSVTSAIPPEQRSTTIVLTRNYGEAGAIDRERRLAGAAEGWLPPVYSGHNAYGEWGPPPDDATTVIMVGEADQDQLQRWFDGTCGLATQVTSPPGVGNEESDAPIRVCRLGEHDWTKLWPEVRRLG